MFIQVFLLTLLSDRSIIQESKVFLIALLVMIHPISFDTEKIIYPLLSLVGLAVGYYMLRNQDMVGSVRLSLQVGDVMQDPNWIAVFLFPSFCLGLTFLQQKKTLLYLVGLAMMAFSLYVVFLTGSRGAILGLIAAFFVWLLISTRRTRFISAIATLLIFLLLGLFFIKRFLPGIDHELIARFTGEERASNAIRISLWSSIIPEYFNGTVLQILFGRGPGSCIATFGWSAHNVFLEQLFQMGLIGCILMFLFFFKLTKDTIMCENFVGLYILTALIILSLTTPIWGHLYFMTPIAMVIYVNNAIKIRKQKGLV